MKKIFVSTVEQTTNIAVITVNPYLIAKAIRTEVLLQQIAQKCKHETKTVDETTGEKTTKVEYYDYIGKDNIRALMEDILPFISELTAAFEE